MRKLASFLFMSLDGVVEAPHGFSRSEVFEDFSPLIAKAIDGQDAVLLGRKTYDEWAQFWPDSRIEPFATFINSVPKHVVSQSSATLAWLGSTALGGNLIEEVSALKKTAGRDIGVHGSISLVQSLLKAGLIDEMQFVVVPVVAGRGRRLLSHDGEPIQLSLAASHSTPTGLQYLTFHPLG